MNMHRAETITEPLTHSMLTLYPCADLTHKAPDCCGKLCAPQWNNGDFTEKYYFAHTEWVKN